MNFVDEYRVVITYERFDRDSYHPFGDDWEGALIFYRNQKRNIGKSYPNRVMAVRLEHRKVSPWEDISE